VTGSESLSLLSAQFLQSTDAGMLKSSAQFLGGVKPGVTARSNSSVD